MENGATINRLAIFGGSFDPPHIGHVLAVLYLRMTEPYDRIFMIPCGEHPFGKRHTPFAHRMEMCRIAFESLGPGVEVLDIENRRKGTSYTIDTVREIAALYPQALLDLVIGADIVPELPLWKDLEALRELVRFRILKRLSEERPPEEWDLEDPFYIAPISSTTVRARVAVGADISRHVPRQVAAYIREQGLYRE